MIKEIRYKIIPQEEQRYETIGDYWEVEPGIWEVRVSDVGSWRQAFAVFIHEAIELGLTQARGISEPTIKEFDEHFEASNKDPEAEPGDHILAPYRREHRFAENLERLFVAELGMPWDAYSENIIRYWRHEGQ